MKISTLLGLIYSKSFRHNDIQCIVGSVVECSPATRAARVRFPDDANFVLAQQILENMKIRKVLEAPGIDPGTSRMLSERSTI